MIPFCIKKRVNIQPLKIVILLGIIEQGVEMNLFSQIVSEEKLRIEKMISDYEQELLSLPRGSLVCKTVKGRQYYYLQFRDGKRVMSTYIGADGQKTNELRKQIDRRRHIEAMLKTLQGEYTQANKLTGL